MTALPTVPTQPAVGDPVTAAYGDEVAQWVAFLAAPPIFEGYLTTPQTITTSTWTAITLDTSVVDSVGGHSTTVNPTRYTAQYPGWYMVYGRLGINANATGYRSAELYVNGVAVPISRTDTPGTSVGGVQPEAIVLQYLNVGDYVEVYGFQNSGSSLTTTASQCYMIVRWVSS